MVGLRLGTWGGWAYVDTGEAGEELHIRFAPDESGRMVIGELRIARAGGISGSDLRRLPLGQIEEMGNAPETYPRLQGLLQVERPDVTESDAMFWANRAAAGPVPLMPSPEELRMFGLLDIPTTVRKPDDFYREVAELYSRLAQSNRNPATHIAKANDVPVTTVHRWVKEARRRGFLAPGRRGTGGKDARR